MTFTNRTVTFLLLLLFCIGTASAEDMLARYQKADSFMPKNISKLVKNISINPHWIAEGSSFWFVEQTNTGSKYRVYNAKSNMIKDAFDHQKMALLIGTKKGAEISTDSLNLSGLEFSKDLKTITLTVNDTIFTTDQKLMSLTEKPAETKLPKNQSESPDKKWIVSVRNYNLHLKNVATGEEKTLTTDGIEKFDYATPYDNWTDLIDITKKEVYDPKIYVSWTKDSKKFFTYKLDRRKIGLLYLYQSMPDSGFRAKVWAYERGLPGEDVITYQFYAFDVNTATSVKLETPPMADVCIAGWPQWLDKTDNITLSFYDRGYQTRHLYVADAKTGAAKEVINEHAKTMIETQLSDSRWLDDNKRIVCTSEQDGWNHIYLYNNDGKLINQVTKGEFVVVKMHYIDDKNNKIFFTACGVDKTIDPYLTQLFSINMDGSNMTLLTPEKAYHSITISPDNKTVVDNFSTINSSPQTVIRRLKDGKIINRPIKADISALLATGWRFPEPFKTKARDGKTDIYGAIFYPSDFDATKSYPIIDGTYSGPQAVRTPKTFTSAYRAHDVAFAELGFIVVTVDGLGSAMRSKKFHDFSYRNLGDIGAEDHIKAINDLAKTRPYMNRLKVGIYGHSAGGYDAVHALLTHPEFYSVGISSAGNHDHRIAKAWWPEQYMGIVGSHYDEQSNFKLAGNLEGKLLLIHGDMDNNVNPTSTLRMAGELIKQNKDFDMLIIPNKNHGGVYQLSYFQRKRWDYFVKNLMNVEPPKNYKITNYE